MDSSKKPIRLFWWCEPYFMHKDKENYGDVLGKYLVEKISGRPVRFVNPRKWHFKDYFAPIYATAGSILAHVNKHCVVWGSGIILENQVVKPAKFLAVRGPQTRKRLLLQGHQVPKVFGDPALLLPLYYKPKLSKKNKFGIIPHYNDFKTIKPFYENKKEVLLIDLMTNDIEATTDLILSCERIVSSSLHGLIVAHAYGIPAVWTPFSDKPFGDGIKFQDYFDSVEIESYKPEIVDKNLSLQMIENLFHQHPHTPAENTIKELQDGLMRVCPFKS
ncbi:MAG: polysaccharide pyruvyl transferase family protein [Flavobacteriaceae bacterium]|nr:polysaccharide pyruvyl transferase family protein [Flavobacteriaceae bacterium]